MLAVAVLAPALPLRGQDAAAPPANDQRPTTSDGASSLPRTHALIVAGIGGEPKYVEQFADWGIRLHDALALRLGDGSRIVLLTERPERDSRRIAGPSTRERVLQEIAGFSQTLKAGDQLLLVLIGHGSPGRENPRLNLPGPDLGAAELSAALDPFAGYRVVIINTASASGDFVPVLSAPNRVVVTATKTGYERNETRFAQFLIDGLGGGAADTDKDGSLSVLELFEYASRETARSYQEETRLLTEHAILDDDGDKAGTAKPDPVASADGRLARSIVLGQPAMIAVSDSTSADPRIAGLMRTRDSLESELRALQGRRDRMDTAAYDRALEALMLDLARTSRALRDARGEGTP